MNNIYVTDHSKITIKAENFAAAYEACKDDVRAYATNRGWEPAQLENIQTLGGLLDLMHLEYQISDETGDIVDIFLATSDFPEASQRFLIGPLAPYVEAGSRMVVAFGGDNGIWGCTWERNPATGVIEGSMEDFVTVSKSDMRNILTMLKALHATIPFNEYNEKYGPLEEE